MYDFFVFSSVYRKNPGILGFRGFECTIINIIIHIHTIGDFPKNKKVSLDTFLFLDYNPIKEYHLILSWLLYDKEGCKYESGNRAVFKKNA